MNDSTPIRITSARHLRTGTQVMVNRVADPGPLAVTDDVLFRWARIVQIAKMFPIMHTIRALEHKLQTGVCRSCKSQQTAADIDRSALAEARRQLAECTDDQARLVKEAAGVLQYRVAYHDLSGTLREIVR